MCPECEERKKRKSEAMKRWRLRKKNLPVPVLAEPGLKVTSKGVGIGTDEARESTRTDTDSRGGQRPSIVELRKLIERVPETTEQHVAKPSVYRDDYGRVISERQWNLLQKKKEAAKVGGYEIDQWSQ